MGVASGYANVALAMGWERMDEVDTRTGNYYIATAACKDFEPAWAGFTHPIMPPWQTAFLKPLMSPR